MLDSAYTFYLDRILYQGGGGLQVILLEASVQQEQKDVQLTEDYTIKCAPIAPTAGSRRFAICFKHPVVWQVVEDEAWYGDDEEEVRDDAPGTLQVIHQSKYLAYVKKNHGWYELSLGPATHYRIVTEQEVIDVIACEEPKVEVLKAGA